jgi:hypothetical protein
MSGVKSMFFARASKPNGIDDAKTTVINPPKKLAKCKVVRLPTYP